MSKNHKPWSRYEVIIHMGTPVWSRHAYDFRLGKYHWLWTARFAAWWHVQVNPWRAATVLSLME